MPEPSATGPRGHALAPEEFRFELPGRLEYRDAARAFLAHVCDRLTHRGHLPEDAGHRVISAFVEGFNNAVIHAYAGRHPGPVRVELEVDDARLQVRIIDRGSAFALEEVPEPDLDTLPEGGLGLFIIRNFMDEVRYERRDQENVLTMEKRLTADGDAARGAESEAR